MAERLFNKLASAAKRRGWAARSCGLAAQPFVSVPEEVWAALAPYDVKADAHRPTRINPEAVGWASDVYAMTSSQRDALKSMYPDKAGHIHLFLEAAGLEPRDVDDPIGQKSEVYKRCCEIIHRGVRALIERTSTT